MVTPDPRPTNTTTTPGRPPSRHTLSLDQAEQKLLDVAIAHFSLNMNKMDSAAAQIMCDLPAKIHRLILADQAPACATDCKFLLNCAKYEF